MTLNPKKSEALRMKLASLLGAVLVCSSLAIHAYAGHSDDLDSNESSLSAARAFNLERLLDLKGMRTAKGEYVQLSSNAPAAPKLWSQLDLTTDKIPGTSTAKAYKLLKLRKPAEPIIVAVLDSGVDINHPDLKGMIWTNPKEIDNGKDNDGDGYIGDVHGWNFIGNKNGTNLGASTLEVTRELKRMRALAASRALTTEEAAYLAELESTYGTKQKDASDTFELVKKLQADYLANLKVLQDAGLKKETAAAVAAFKPKNQAQAAAKTAVAASLAKGRDSKVWKGYFDSYQNQVAYNYNLDFDPSSIIGDDPTNPTEKFYGNNDVKALGSDHGTHCSGIIAALRKNGIGMDGQTNFVRIMPVRAVPDGDERDKDIANGIRFAVDHGARIISMSFGKPYSPGKELVDAAVAYAAEKGVLLVHAAGNDSADNDKGHNFPTAVALSGTIADNWIEVGASTIDPKAGLPADFSNYGQERVDLFAPGKDIYSTTPDNTYSTFSGTSMATPEVAGVAALVLSQNPKLTPKELKAILTSTVTKFPGLMVNKPNDGTSAPSQVPFSTLSVTGGVVNAYGALKAL